MTTTVYLVRHGRHAAVDKLLCGRMAGIGLDAGGVMQAHRVAERLARKRVDAVQTSPQQRTRETARPIAERLGLPLEVAPAVDELDMGDWTGQPFSALATDTRWQAWNTQRGASCPPRGESMRSAQERIIRHLETLCAHYPGGGVVVVSHAEPIRAAILHCLALDLDQFADIAIDPGSVSTLVVGAPGMQAVSVNERAA